MLMRIGSPPFYSTLSSSAHLLLSSFLPAVGAVISSGGSWQSLRLPEEKEGTSPSTDTVILQELMFNNVSTRNGPKTTTTTTTKTKLIFPDTATRQELMLRRTI